MTVGQRAQPQRQAPRLVRVGVGAAAEEAAHAQGGRQQRDLRCQGVQGGLGLPEREYYLSNDPDMVRIRGEYRAYIERLLTLAELPPGDAMLELKPAELAPTLTKTIDTVTKAPKTAARDRAQLVAYAFRHGLAQP